MTWRTGLRPWAGYPGDYQAWIDYAHMQGRRPAGPPCSKYRPIQRGWHMDYPEPCDTCGVIGDEHCCAQFVRPFMVSRQKLAREPWTPCLRCGVPLQEHRRTVRTGDMLLDVARPGGA